MPAALRILAGVLMLAVCLAAGGAEIYVSPEGTAQGDGSRERPFSLEHVLTKAKPAPGETVLFLDGIYKPPLRIDTVGNDKAPVTWKAENRHKAIFDHGTPVVGWTKAADMAGVWQKHMARAPASFLVNGDALADVTSRWRRDGKTSLDAGMFASEKAEDGVLVSIHPWADKEPKEVFAIARGSLIAVSGAFNIVDGFLVRRGHIGVHLSGRSVHVYRFPRGTLHADLSGLSHNGYGCFNVVRNCIIRDMTSQGMTSNESRFNLIEDNVIYNAGISQGQHGIYVSNTAENLTLRRNVWWRTSGGAIHIYSGGAVDTPRGIVVEANIFGPDKRNRCFPLANRKSTAFYIWGGHRWAGYNRITHNLVIGPYDRAISLNRCYFNLIANNTFLNTDGAPIQMANTYGNVIANNLLEYSPGGPKLPEGYFMYLAETMDPKHSVVTNNAFLLRDGKGKEIPEWAGDARVIASDPFVDRPGLDFRLRPGSAAVDAGAALRLVTTAVAGKAPDAGAVEQGTKAEAGAPALPEIPNWLLEEWPLEKRGN